MKGFDVLKIKSAIKSRNKFDLSHSHLTTMNFGEIVPLCVEETVPGDEFNIKADYFSRMAPLVKPTYGKFQFKTVSAFVPYHQIAVDAEAWLAGKTTMEGQTPHHRFFTIYTLHEFLTSVDISREALTETVFDYSYKNASGTVVNCIFTNLGRYYVKVLNALGYALPSGVNLQANSTWMTTSSNMKLSAYPLLAFFKLYNDYMSQSQRFNTSQLSSILFKIKNNVADGNVWNSSSGEITKNAFFIFFQNLLLNYENDYFTSAWQSPNSALNATESVTSVGVGSVTGYGAGSVTSDTSGTQFNFNGIVQQRALDFLKSFDDWVRRNNYSGSRAVQQIYSRFGIKPDDFRAHYAHVISTDTMPIQVGDVTATADSQNVPLGDYAGKGIMNGSDTVHYKSEDFGLLIILGYFTVSPMMAYGYDRRVLRNTPLDYYNPEFDGVGPEAISVGEVFANPLGINQGDNSTDLNVFGYTERYNSYRYGRDVITGEFRDYNLSADMNTWHTGRLLNNVKKSGLLVAQSSAMNTLSQIDSEYNRIFSVTDGSVDHFYLTCRFDISAIRPILNLNQVPKLGEGDTNVPRNGNTIS